MQFERLNNWEAIACQSQPGLPISPSTARVHPRMNEVKAAKFTGLDLETVYIRSGWLHLGWRVGR